MADPCEHGCELPSPHEREVGDEWSCPKCDRLWGVAELPGPGGVTGRSWLQICSQCREPLGERVTGEQVSLSDGAPPSLELVVTGTTVCENPECPAFVADTPS